MKQTLSQFPITPSNGSLTATKVRLAADVQFIASTGEVHLPGDSRSNYTEYSLTADGDNRLFPASVIDSTTDSSDPNATYSMFLVNSLGREVGVLFERWAFPAMLGTPVSFEALDIHNTFKIPLRDDQTYSKLQTENLIQTLIQGMFNETPAGTIDGVNATFVLSHTPIAGSLLLFWNGQLTNDYLRSGTTLVLSTPPLVGDSLLASYRTASGLVSGGDIPAQLQESSGPTVLSMGAIADRKVFRRSGSTVIGVGYEQVFDSADYATLNAAVTAIGATAGKLLISAASLPSGSSVTIPATLVLDWGSEGTLTLATGQTVIIKSDPSQWPIRQLFLNAQAGQGTIAFTDNRKIVALYSEWWGAVADRVGTAGTDSTGAIQAAIVALETVPSVGILQVTGEFLVRNLTASSTCLLITKGIILQGLGGSKSGIYASADTPITTDIVTYRPSTHPGNENFTVRDIVIGSSEVTPGGAGAYVATGHASARHALVLDVSLGVGNITVRYFHMENTKLLPNFGNGAAAGNYGLATVGTSVHGSPAQSYIGPNNLIFNGLFMAAIGDTVTIEGNTFMVFNDLAVTQVTGATTLAILRNNITLRKGVSIGRSLGMSFTGNVVELVEADSTGSAGACVDIVGPVTGGEIHTNEITCLAPSPAFHGLQIQSGNANLDVDKNSFRVDPTKFGINHILGATLLGRNTYTAGGAFQTGATTTNQLEPKVYGFNNMPASGVGVGLNLSLIGNARFSNIAGTAPSVTTDNLDTAMSGGYILRENGVLTGYLIGYGSLNGTVALRNDLELFNTTATGDLRLGTNSITRLTINAAGILSTFFGANVASAAAIVPTGNLFHVTGTTNITSITSTGIIAGTKITIIFDDVLTVTDGSNLVLAGNFVTSAGDTISLVYDGTSWFEVGRSVN